MIFSNLSDSVLLWFDCYLGWHCVNEPYRARQDFRGDHLHKCDVGKGTNMCVLGSIKEKAYIKSHSSLFSPLKLDSPIPHPKISDHSATSAEHACSIPTYVSFADTNWKRGPWQNGVHWEKENISVIVMLIGKRRGVVCMYLPWFIHGSSIHFLCMEKKNCLLFFFFNYLDNAKKRNQANVSGFPQLKESWI